MFFNIFMWFLGTWKQPCEGDKWFDEQCSTWIWNFCRQSHAPVRQHYTRAVRKLFFSGFLFAFLLRSWRYFYT